VQVAIAALALAGCAWIAPADAPRTGGPQPNAPAHNHWLSSNGRYVFYDSTATDLVPETEGVVPDVDTGGVYRHDNRTGRTVLLFPGMRLTRDPGISQDLQRMLMIQNGTYVVHDRETGETKPLALRADLSRLPGITIAATLSADGRLAALRQSRPESIRTYVRNLDTGATKLVLTIPAAPDNPYVGTFSDLMSISRDGSIVTHGSCAASNDLPGVPDCTAYSFEIVDVASGAVRRPFPEQGRFNARLSADGRFVAYTDGQDVWTYNRNTMTRTLISVGADGGPSQGSSPSISATGRYVAFSSAVQIVPGLDPFLGHFFTYVRDRVRRVTTHVSAYADGTPALQWNGEPAISADGRYVTFAHHDVIGPREPQTKWRLLTKAALIPRIASVAPSTAGPGTTARVSITGYGFRPDAVVVFGRDGVELPTANATVTEVSIALDVTIPAGTDAGAFDVTVYDPGGGPGQAAGAGAVCRGCVSVSAQPTRG
jgi:Tol biopolymer transport system component